MRNPFDENPDFKRCREVLKKKLDNGYELKKMPEQSHYDAELTTPYGKVIHLELKSRWEDKKGKPINSNTFPTWYLSKQKLDINKTLYPNDELWVMYFWADKWALLDPKEIEKKETRWIEVKSYINGAGKEEQYIWRLEDATKVKDYDKQADL